MSEPHRTFLTSKFLFFRVNLEVNLDIRHILETDPTLPLSHACVTLPVVAQAFLEGEEMPGTAWLRTDQHPVRSKQRENITRKYNNQFSWSQNTFYFPTRVEMIKLMLIKVDISERPVSMKCPVPGETVPVSGVVTTVRSPAQQPHDCSSVARPRSY